MLSKILFPVTVLYHTLFIYHHHYRTTLVRTLAKLKFDKKTPRNFSALSLFVLTTLYMSQIYLQIAKSDDNAPDTALHSQL